MSTSGPPSPLLSFRGERITSLTRSQSELARPGGSPRESFSGSPVTGSLLQIGSRNSELIASASVRTALGNPIVRAKCRAALCEEIVVDMQVCRRGKIQTQKESSDFDLSPRSKSVAVQMIREELAKRNITSLTAGQILGDVTTKMRSFMSN